jgi:hypothetical protein
MPRTILAAVLSSALVAGQAPRRDLPVSNSGTGTIVGRVVAAETGDPVRKARVTADSEVGRAPTVYSDADGRFTIAGLAPGRYIVAAQKPGFVKTVFGRSDRDATPLRVDVAADAQATGIELRMARAAAVSGRVVDENGEPLALANVTAESVDGLHLKPAASSQTNDLGEYRLGNLPAGNFLVSVTAIDSPIGPLLQLPDPNFSLTMVMFDASGAAFTLQFDSRQIPRRYYPGGVRQDGAQAIAVGSGEEKIAIDFTVVPALPRLMPLPRFFGSSPVSEPSARARIRGRITNAEGRALSRAHVRLMSQDPPSPGRFATTPGDGTYEFSQVPAGDYIVSATKSGYIAQQFGERSPSRRREILHVGPGRAQEHVDMALSRESVIAGRVLDENGDPVERARVRVLKTRFVQGRRRFVTVEDIRAPLTDDLGNYRAFNVPPGDYVVSAEIGEVMTADVPGYAPTYSPGITDPAAAQVVTVDVAQQLSGIDVMMQQVKTARISGHIFDSHGEPWTGAVTLDVSERSGAPLTASMGARLEPDGSFEFPNVVPGEYVLRIRKPPSNRHTEGEFAARFITVTGTDIDGVVVRGSRGSTITGRVTLDGAGVPRRDQIDFVPTPIDPDTSPLGMGSAAAAELDDDWKFELDGIVGPRRLTLERAPEGWALKVVLAHGLDVTDKVLPFGTETQSIGDLEVVLTDRIARLVGTVSDGRARPVVDYKCLVFAVDRDKWYPASRFVEIASPKSDGTFDIQRLPGGDYFVAAVDDARDDDNDRWRDPAFLEGLTSRATRVSLTEGLTASVSVKLIR